MSSSRDQRREAYEQLIGSQVADGRFEITRLLGFGGMGAVYEATQMNMNRQVALKLIATHDPTTVARFEREAFTISKLRHPNTITVFDFGQADHFLFLSMELLEGLTLTEFAKQGLVPPDRAVHIAAQICRSLSEAHGNGIVHRDVKPDNIILIRVDDDPDVVKVLDFGIAKAVLGEDDVQLTGDGRIIGTPRYMSPEQILAEPVDHRSDIYSLSCIIFEMLCGAPPFQQSSTTALMISHTQDPPPAFAQRLEPGTLARMPAGLERVVRKGLSKNPNSRHQDCDELRIDLENALVGLNTPSANEFPDDITAAAVPSAMDRSGTHSNERSGVQPVANSNSGLQQVAIPAHVTQFPTEEEKPKTLLFLGLIAVAIVLGAIAFFAMGPPKEATEPKEIASIVVPEQKDEKSEEAETNAPTYIALTIESTPEGASIFEGDASIGTTPKQIRVDSVKTSVDYRLELDGYDPQQIRVRITGDAVQKEQFRLTKRRVVKSKKNKIRRPVVKDEPEEKKPKVGILTEEDKPKVPALDD